MKEIELKEQKKIQLDILLYFKEICERNELKYYLANGSLLGAVKYKGYIPWDDDIDVYLLRKDYEKLINIMANNNNSNYKLLCSNNTKDYYYPFAKIVDTRTKVFENSKEIKEYGIFIDVFPMDYFDNSKEYYKKIRFVRNMASRRFKIKNKIEKISNKTREEKETRFRYIKNLVYSIVDIVSRPLGYCFWTKKLEDLTKRYNTGKEIAMLYKDPYKIFDAKLFDETDEYEFENNYYTSIKDYDKYLTYLYGDYEKDLPKEAQRSHHQIKAFWRE